jgi:hypothetical protein
MIARTASPIASDILSELSACYNDDYSRDLNCSLASSSEILWLHCSHRNKKKRTAIIKLASLTQTRRMARSGISLKISQRIFIASPPSGESCIRSVAAAFRAALLRPASSTGGRVNLQQPRARRYTRRNTLGLNSRAPFLLAARRHRWESARISRQLSAAFIAKRVELRVSVHSAVFRVAPLR